MDKRENTLPVKVTLRPKQIKEIKTAARKLDNNFSLALRVIVDTYKERRAVCDTG